MSSSYAKTLLMRQEGVFPGVNYGFPADTAAEVAGEFPDCVVVWRATHNRMELWACGDHGALMCLDNDLQPWQNAKLVEQIRENRLAAERYKIGDMGRQIRARLDREREEKIAAQVNAMDPEREAREVMARFGNRINPIAVPESLPAM